MCGIGGLAIVPGAAPPSQARLASLAAALGHRGPDGTGSSVVGRVALLHCRLAIVDLAGGDQPLFGGDTALVANAEIYNDLAARAERAPAAYATGSDCETALRLYLERGGSFAGGLRGMWAIALHDRAARALLLSRDPFGIKPLYLATGPDGVAFASEAGALIRGGVGGAAGEMRADKCHELLQLGFTTGRDTIFPGIERLGPGETVRIVDGHVLDRQHMSALPEGGPEEIGEDAALVRLDAALADSVAAHLRSDVGTGLFLSGGIDSTALLAAITRQGAPVRSFTARFDVPGAADESAHAARLAASLGARHDTLTIDRETVWRHLPAIVAATDDPVADYAIIPTWLLARRARAEGMKVILSGEGGDEMFGGYGRYRRAMRPWWQGGRPARAKGRFDGLDVLRPSARSAWRDGLRTAEAAASGGDGRSRFAAAQAVDMADWLPNDLLLKLDRCLMAHGIEGRTPFLDPVVAAASFRLPDRLKTRHGLGKHLLRTWLASACPESRPFEPKQGFTVPVGDWIASAGDRLGELVARAPAIEAIAEPSRVRALFRAADGRRARHAAWTLLYYALWHRIHVSGQMPDGDDVFGALARR